MSDEAARLRALAESEALETPPEPAFDRLVKLAAVLMDVPHVAMNLVDDRRTWAKAAVGIPHGYEVDRSHEPFCATTIQRPDTVTVIEDTHLAARTRENVMTRRGVRFYAGAPLVTGDGHAIGTLCVTDVKPRQPTPGQLEALTTLAAAIAAHLELRRLAAQDALTGLANRRTFDNTLRRALAHAAAAGSELGVIMIDVDRFKAYNDARGHIAGDRLLRHFADRWRELAGGVTLLARYGGEEFAVVAEGRTLGELEQLAARICGTVADGQTCSAGVALWRPGETHENLVHRADERLYDAKSAGRHAVRS